MPEFVKAATTGQIPPGEGKLVEAGGKKIALFNVDGTFYAIDNTCTHRGGPLSEGMVEGTEVTCPWHGAVFNITSGAVLGPPAPRGVASYAVRVEGDDIEVDLPGPARLRGLRLPAPKKRAGQTKGCSRLAQTKSQAAR